MLRMISTAAITAMMAGGLGLLAPQASASSSPEVRSQTVTASQSDSGAQRVRCGATIKRLSAGPGPLGNKRWTIYYRNCTNTKKKRKVDIENGRDLPCKTAKPGKTITWPYRTGYFGPDHPRSVKPC